jgi:uncharacterized protein YjcR
MVAEFLVILRPAVMDLWLACYTNTEITEKVNVDATTVAKWIEEEN